jgi:hypothetical protein
MKTRAHHLREIIGHLDALVADLDGADHKCEACGLNVKDNWSEANAKGVLADNRKKFVKMLSQEWGKKGES